MVINIPIISERLSNLCHILIGGCDRYFQQSPGKQNAELSADYSGLVYKLIYVQVQSV